METHINRHITILEPDDYRPYFYKNFITLNIEHRFSNLENELPELSDLEIKMAFNEYNQALKEFQIREYGKGLSETDYLNFSHRERMNYLQKNSKFVMEFRKSKKSLYEKLLSRLPIIGLMRSSNPTNDEFKQMIDTLIINNQELENNLTNEHVISYSNSVKRLLSVNSSYCSNSKRKIK